MEENQMQNNIDNNGGNYDKNIVDDFRIQKQKDVYDVLLGKNKIKQNILRMSFELEELRIKYKNLPLQNQNNTNLKNKITKKLDKFLKLCKKEESILGHSLQIYGKYFPILGSLATQYLGLVKSENTFAITNKELLDNLTGQFIMRENDTLFEKSINKLNIKKAIIKGSLISILAMIPANWSQYIYNESDKDSKEITIASNNIKSNKGGNDKSENSLGFGFGDNFDLGDFETGSDIGIGDLVDDLRTGGFPYDVDMMYNYENGGLNFVEDDSEASSIREGVAYTPYITENYFGRRDINNEPMGRGTTYEQLGNKTYVDLQAYKLDWENNFGGFADWYIAKGGKIPVGNGKFVHINEQEKTRILDMIKKCDLQKISNIIFDFIDNNFVDIELDKGGELGLQYRVKTQKEINNLIFDNIYTVPLDEGILGMYSRKTSKDMDIYIDMRKIHTQEELENTLIHEILHGVIGTSGIKTRDEGLTDLLTVSQIYKSTGVDTYEISDTYANYILNMATININGSVPAYYNLFMPNIYYKYDIYNSKNNKTIADSYHLDKKSNKLADVKRALLFDIFLNYPKYKVPTEFVISMIMGEGRSIYIHKKILENELSEKNHIDDKIIQNGIAEILAISAGDNFYHLDKEKQATYLELADMYLLKKHKLMITPKMLDDLESKYISYMKSELHPIDENPDISIDEKIVKYKERLVDYWKKNPEMMQEDKQRGPRSVVDFASPNQKFNIMDKIYNKVKLEHFDKGKANTMDLDNLLKLRLGNPNEKLLDNKKISDSLFQNIANDAFMSNIRFKLESSEKLSDSEKIYLINFMNEFVNKEFGEDGYDQFLDYALNSAEYPFYTLAIIYIIISCIYMLRAAGIPSKYNPKKNILLSKLDKIDDGIYGYTSNNKAFAIVKNLQNVHYKQVILVLKYLLITIPFCIIYLSSSVSGAYIQDIKHNKYIIDIIVDGLGIDYIIDLVLDAGSKKLFLPRSIFLFVYAIWQSVKMKNKYNKYGETLSNIGYQLTDASKQKVESFMRNYIDSTITYTIDGDGNKYVGHEKDIEDLYNIIEDFKSEDLEKMNIAKGLKKVLFDNIDQNQNQKKWQKFKKKYTKHKLIQLSNKDEYINNILYDDVSEIYQNLFQKTESQNYKQVYFSNVDLLKSIISKDKKLANFTLNVRNSDEDNDVLYSKEFDEKARLEKTKEKLSYIYQIIEQGKEYIINNPDTQIKINILVNGIPSQSLNVGTQTDTIIVLNNMMHSMIYSARPNIYGNDDLANIYNLQKKMYNKQFDEVENVYFDADGKLHIGINLKEIPEI